MGESGRREPARPGPRRRRTWESHSGDPVVCQRAKRSLPAATSEAAAPAFLRHGCRELEPEARQDVHHVRVSGAREQRFGKARSQVTHGRLVRSARRRGSRDSRSTGKMNRSCRPMRVGMAPAARAAGGPMGFGFLDDLGQAGFDARSDVCALAASQLDQERKETSAFSTFWSPFWSAAVRAFGGELVELAGLPGRVDQGRRRAHHRCTTRGTPVPGTGFVGGRALREETGRLIAGRHRGQDPRDPAVLGGHGPVAERLIALHGRLVVELAEDPHEGVVDGRVAAGVGRCVDEPPECGERVGPEARAGDLGGDALELLLAQIERVVAGIVDRCSSRRPRDRLSRRLRPPAASPSSNWRRASMSNRDCSGSGWPELSNALVAASTTATAAVASSGSLRASAGKAARQASSEVARDESFLSRAARPLSVAVAAAASLAASSSWADRTAAAKLGHGLAFAGRDRLLQVVGLARPDGPGCQQRADALRVSQVALIQGRGVKEDLTGPAGRKHRVAQRLVDGIVGNLVFLPDPLELDQAGDDLRPGLVDGGVVDGAGHSDHAAAFAGIGRDDRRPGLERLASGAQAELGDVVLGGQPGDLDGLLEAIDGQDRQVGPGGGSAGDPWSDRGALWKCRVRASWIGEFLVGGRLGFDGLGWALRLVAGGWVWYDARRTGVAPDADRAGGARWAGCVGSPRLGCAAAQPNRSPRWSRPTG